MRPASKTNEFVQESYAFKSSDMRQKSCENSRSISSTFSHEEESSTNSSSTPNPTSNSSKGSDNILEHAKTVQVGMAD
ncbi:unnamed protein product [Parnassius apollo]|uniref:(apollo) hypothetical protein n=1 Tax=Parnassius apollo TaxID=110799 RepID=A0A8S3XJ17_PARAO|nr:unnamed protein product [Parnassius apollo]